MPVENRLDSKRPHIRAVAICTGLLAVLVALPRGAAPVEPTVSAASWALVSQAPRAPVPGTPCTVFPRDNVWNTDISRVPLHRKSSTWLRSMKASGSTLHPAFGRRPYGMPYAVVSNFHPKVPIRFEWSNESDPGPYPFGLEIPLEQNDDRHALMINKETCTLYELFRADWNGGLPRAGSGAIFSLSSNRLRPNGWTSADAAGLPILAGLLRYDEVMSGAITHAIRFTTPRTDCRHIWPARHHVGGCNRSYPPMGARFRLKAGYNISRFSWSIRVILRAFKRYGLILADNGPNWYVGGTMDSRWTDRILRELKTVPASAFQVVNESVCILDSNSGAARCP